MFYHRNDAVESEMTREMLRFTIETNAGGREGRWCHTAVAGYVRLWFKGILGARHCGLPGAV